MHWNEDDCVKARRSFGYHARKIILALLGVAVVVLLFVCFVHFVVNLLPLNAVRSLLALLVGIPVCVLASMAFSALFKYLPRVSIGDAGLVVVRLGRRDCIGWDEIQHVELLPGSFPRPPACLMLHARSGRSVRIEISLQGFEELIRSIKSHVHSAEDLDSECVRFVPERECRRRAVARTKAKLLGIPAGILMLFVGIGLFVGALYFAVRRFDLFDAFLLVSFSWFYLSLGWLGLTARLRAPTAFMRLEVAQCGKGWSLKASHWSLEALVRIVPERLAGSCVALRRIRYLRSNGETTASGFLARACRRSGIETERLASSFVILTSESMSKLLRRLGYEETIDADLVVTPHRDLAQARQWLLAGDSKSRGLFFCRDRRIGPFDGQEVRQVIHRLICLMGDRLYGLAPPVSLREADLVSLVECDLAPGLTTDIAIRRLKDRAELWVRMGKERHARRIAFTESASVVQTDAPLPGFMRPLDWSRSLLFFGPFALLSAAIFFSVTIAVQWLSDWQERRDLSAARRAGAKPNPRA